MTPPSCGNIDIEGDTDESVLVTGSHNVVIQAEQVMLQAAEEARREKRDPAQMLRVLALLAAPVFDPRNPDQAPTPLDLHQEWHVLAEGVRRSNAPILLARLAPATLAALRSALSPRAEMQNSFPHILHFSGHAWREGLLLEGELGEVHLAKTEEILEALKDLPHPLDLVVLNGCESAADASSAAQAMVDGGLARAVMGHERSVLDAEAVKFASTLYAELTGGFPLGEAVARAQKEVTTHKVILLGDKELCFQNLSGGEPWVDQRSPPGNLPAQTGLFLGRGRELVDMAHHLSHPPAVVVISGPPGIGKTGLVLEAAHRNSRRFPGGVAYASGRQFEGSREATAAEMLKDLAEPLGLTPEPERLIDELLQKTAKEPTLLLLDNLETLPEEERARLAEVLRRLGGESAAIVALRPSSEALEDLPRSRPISLHHGLSPEEAARYAMFLARQREIPLTWDRAAEIAEAVGGHPLLLEKLVAQARRRDLEDLLQEVAERRGDYQEQLAKVYSRSAERLDDAGLDALKALQLFPAGSAPEVPLLAAAGEGGPAALQEAALADFDPAEQVWHWHATVAEYARIHWPLSEDERRSRLIDLLPAWTAWLKRLVARDMKSHMRLEKARPNLQSEMEVCTGTSYEEAWSFLDALDRALPSPERTLSLREIIAEVQKAKLEILPSDDYAQRACLLNNLGLALSNLGQREKAIKPSQEAAEIYRQLAEADPQVFLPNLAASLNNLGMMLSNQGRREKALKPSQEAAEIYRQLAEAEPQVFLPDLAASLNNLGVRLSDLGRREEAIIPSQEAAEIYRQLAEAEPQVFLPYLAMSLNNLGNRLYNLGRRKEAILPSQEAAAEIYRRLAEANPQAFLPNLAASLNNIGALLSELGRREEALKPTQEAVEIRRRLAEEKPQAFLPDLAMSLNNLGVRLSDLGRLEEALIPSQEAVEIRRRMAEANPQAFLPALSMCLNNLGVLLSRLGRLEEALIPSQEAVEIRRRMAEANPQAFLPDMATSLGAYGSILGSLDRHAEAARAFGEGLELIAPFYLKMPQAFGRLARFLLQGYLQACQGAGQEPDEELMVNFKEMH
ncbi:MAG TPA: tetratricopeptide repeat protein [Methanothrix sp.]|nr:tetratricopeptide repeat protein [Methanothrix sp.]